MSRRRIKPGEIRQAQRFTREDPGDLLGEHVLLDEGPGYVEAYDGEMFTVDLFDSRRSFRMRRDEVEDAIRRDKPNEEV